MLNSRFEVVGFTGREKELADLRRWRDHGPRLSVQWLHAPGGQGKSRLAAQFVKESEAAGWTVATAARGPGVAQPSPGTQDLRTDTRAGVLLVVDYADRWPVTHLTWLLSNALLHRPTDQARVLQLARTGTPGLPYAPPSPASRPTPRHGPCRPWPMPAGSARASATACSLPRAMPSPPSTTCPRASSSRPKN
ncbi:ATP-binding protein (plasmid) [Streptomyces sp. NBC_00984]|uniref:ATP-binding protein n=1 Tax=Streptomyces sp. NBC_00984 TaxID=2903700 RepID=UPI002F90D2F2|nr:ATP-binding protein [Streptomyces sp. NBC_00984]